MEQTLVPETSAKLSMPEEKEASEVEPQEDTPEDPIPELYFERETAMPDFEREAVYDVDSFGKKPTRVEKLLAPPPDFQKSLKALSPDLQEKFKAVLNGDIVGIWPIRHNFLLK